MGTGTVLGQLLLTGLHLTKKTVLSVFLFIQTKVYLVSWFWR
jgi:hypothetical protein